MNYWRFKEVEDPQTPPPPVEEILQTEDKKSGEYDFSQTLLKLLLHIYKT